MDNLTHTLLGAALARTRLGRLSPYSTGALVIGANLPDLDAVVRLWAGREGYLVHHRGITHAVTGTVALTLGLAAALRALEHRRQRRTGEPVGSWIGALTLAAVALASHPLLDLLNVYGLRPWLPFDPRWIYGDVAFIVDPWLWLALGAGALLAGPARRAGTWAWGVVFALGATAVAAATTRGLVPGPAAALWFLGLSALAIGRLRGWGRLRPARTLVACFGAAGLYLALLAGLGPRAEAMARDSIEARLEPGEIVSDVTHAPSPIDPLSWSVLVETDRAVHVADLHLVQGIRELRRLPRLVDDPRVRAAMAADCADAWRSFVRHPYAAIHETDEGTWVELMDARYQQGPSPAAAGRSDGRPRGSWCSAEVFVGPDGAADCDR